MYCYFYVSRVTIKKNCLIEYKEVQEHNCNMVVTENQNNSYKLKIKGRDIESQEVILLNPEPIAWRPLSEFINFGDTVVKYESEAIMYVYKRDSIIEMTYVGLCNENFDWDNSVKISLRNKKQN